ncbi:MAG TPA: hypothetical protein VKB41_00660 [Steroidobacteraceae bacterium]|jgi:hypothetical protein|nr:hypothetical protein [Steroidobacteraceae bacterium]
MLHRLRNTAKNWKMFAAWLRACLRCAWRGTHDHFSRGWRSVAEAAAPGLAVTLALYLRAHGADSAHDHLATLATGAAASLLWVGSVLCWNAWLAPYRLWRAALTRMSKLAVVRRIDPRVIRRELELLLRQGQVLMDARNPSKRVLSVWYGRVLRAASRAGQDHRALLENLGPAPGTRGGPLELLILSNRIDKLRLILDRVSSSRKSENVTGLGPRRIHGV